MDFLSLAEKRQSVRRFDQRKVDRGILDKCVEAARLAPSACNSQPWKFIMVDEPELVKDLSACTYGGVVRFNKFTENAAAFAVVVMEPGSIVSKAGAVFSNTDYAHIDMGIAVENFCLQATELGVGTCILGWSRHGCVRKLLGIPKHKRVGLIIAIGYEKDPVLREKKRKPIDEISSYNKY